MSITSSQSDMTEAELNKTDIREFKIGRISNTVSTSIGLANSTFQVMCIPFYNSYPGQLFLSVGRTPAIIYHRCCINGQWQAPVLLASENDLYKAKYVSDLMGAQDYPVFVYWDSNTKNTPYATGKTSSTQGFAIAYGNYSTHQTVFAMAKGTSDIFIHYCSNGSPSGWLVK